MKMKKKAGATVARKRDAKKKPAAKSPAARKPAAKREPSALGGSSGAATRAATYTPPSVEVIGIGWAPFRYPPR